MPGTKRKYNPAWTKTAAASKKRKSTAVVSVPRGIVIGKNVIRRRQSAVLRYADIKRLSGDVATKSTAFMKFHANGMYDPDAQLGGHQPRGFDQLSALYDEYFVRRCQIEVTFSTLTSTNEWLPFIAIRPSDVEFPEAVNILEGPDRVIAKTTVKDDGNGRSSTYLTLSVDPSKWIGNIGEDNEDARANIVNNPVDACVFYVGVINTSTATATCLVDCVVNLTYEAVFMNPKTPAPS